MSNCLLLHGGVHRHSFQIFAFTRPRFGHRKALLQQRDELLFA
jgi:hypothetical protein